jgi:hypothetical protein
MNKPSNSKRKEGCNMNIILRFLFMIVGGYYLFQNRYKVLNVLLGIQGIRQFVVATSMKIPGVKDRLMQQAFKM